jgi:hypothetical protein
MKPKTYLETSLVGYLTSRTSEDSANAALRSRIEVICRLAGFEPPVICTPLGAGRGVNDAAVRSHHRRDPRDSRCHCQGIRQRSSEDSRGCKVAAKGERATGREAAAETLKDGQEGFLSVSPAETKPSGHHLWGILGAERNPRDPPNALPTPWDVALAGFHCRVGVAGLCQAEPERGKVWKPSQGFHYYVASPSSASNRAWSKPRSRRPRTSRMGTRSVGMPILAALACNSRAAAGSFSMSL